MMAGSIKESIFKKRSMGMVSILGKMVDYIKAIGRMGLIMVKECLETLKGMSGKGCGRMVSLLSGRMVKARIATLMRSLISRLRSEVCL
jgi:hypothetical protein